MMHPSAVCVVPEGGDSENYHKNKAKRVRTTFTEEQLQVLQANFQLDSNPDGQDLERIAQITGLSKRVTQVWFQNSRARQKKHLHTGKMKTSSEYQPEMSSSGHPGHGQKCLQGASILDTSRSVTV
jgi:hypothetical protein